MKISSLTASLSVCLFVSAICLTGCTGGGSGGSSSTPAQPTTPATVVPTVASITPASVTAGATSTSITVTGTGFSSSTAIQVGDVVESTTYSSSTQVSATVAAAQLNQGGLLPVIALNTDATSGAGAVVDLTVNNPIPTITSTVPGTLLSGTAAQTVTLLGAGFVPTTVIQVGGTARPTTFVNSGEVLTVLTAADLATSGTLALTAVNPTPAGGTSAALSMPVNNPVPPTLPPTVASISPASLTAGAASTSITVTGTGFTASTAIQVGGVVENTTFSSSTQVSATVAAAQLVQGGLLPVIALNTDGTSGAGAVVDLTVDNPLPTITSTLPATLISGRASRSISVLGTGFVPTTVIQAGGSARPTTFITSGEVNVILTAADQATGGTLALTASNPAPMGGTSAALSTPVNNPVPGITSLSPTFVLTGGMQPVTITVTGINFLPVSVIQVNGTARTTTYVSATQLTFQLTVADQSSAADLPIAVMNPLPGGGTSFTRQLEVTAPAPTPAILSINPNQFLVGSPDTAIEVQVSGAVESFENGPSDTVYWNGTALVTDTVEYSPYGTYLIAEVPASLLATVGTASITVVSPTSTPTTSAAVTVTVTNPPAPTLTSISPSSGPINTATAITLSGTGFTSTSAVAFDGTNVPATFVNSNQLTLTLPAASNALPGNGSFTVTTSAPGGGTTAPLLYTAYIGLANNSVVFNPVNGLFYASVPSSAGSPYGNSIVSIDPETGALGTPILVGSEPNNLAISSDGTILWVGLDGASAVRQVNLTTGTAGLQFSLGASSGYSASLGTALALAALPGFPNSVVVSTSSNFGSGINLGIFDSGVLRGPTTTASGSFNQTFALQVDGTRGEVYAAAQSNYYTFTYGASGLTLLASSTTTATYASSSANDIQVAGGHLYTDFGQVFDAESGSLLGTLYTSGTTAATGPTVADTTLGKVFILDNTSGYSYNGYNQIQVFNTADFTSANASAIPVSVTTNQFGSQAASRLTRWGTNGLAFRTAQGLYSLRSNLVKDLSTTTADISVALATSGGTTTGTSTTYTATISNAGPADATNVALTASIPATGVLQSVTPSAGSCSTSNGVSCNLGGLANGASVTVAFTVLQTASGSAILTAQASASETDPTTSNNSATAAATITGSAYNVVPAIVSISPASIAAGSTDTTLTVTGTGFSSGSTVQLGSTALVTTYVSATSVTATVPAAQLISLGWGAITVANPTPGGGTSSPAALSVYSVITLGVNHILYDPYSRNIMASVGSGSTAVTGNSIVAITPDTGTVGTPVSIGSQPENLALTSDGQILYTILTGNQSVARYNMLTQQADYTYPVPDSAGGYNGVALRGVATVPGTENTVVLDLGAYPGNAIFDFDPANQTAAMRGQPSGFYSGSCDQFLDPTDMINFNIDSGYTLNHYILGPSGFVTTSSYPGYATSNLDQFGCFKLSGGIAYAVEGGVADPAPVPAVQLGLFQPASLPAYIGQTNVVPDTSLQETYFVVNSTSGNQYSSTADSIESFNNNTFVSAGFIPLGFAATEGSNASYNVSDLIRWGQDGLAVLTSTGHIYLLRGAAVVPGELVANPAATLVSSSSTTLTHGSGNTLLTLTGTNFLPGVAVEWNGTYRTTTIVDATHVTVAIPASDLAATGTSTLTAVNPGATASSGLTITIN